MAFATHLTLATGHDLTRHDLPLGEGDKMQNRDEMQRVSVSVTYELERGDLDVPLLATIKASELAQAHRAAAEVLRAHAFAPPAPVCAGLGKGLEEKGLEDTNPFRREEPEGDEPEGERADAEAPPDEAPLDEAFYVPLDDEQAEDEQEAEDSQQSEEEELEVGHEPENGSSMPTYRQWIAGAGMRCPDQSPSPDQASSPGREVPAGQTAGRAVIPGPPPNGSYANGSISPGASLAGGETPAGPLLTPPKRLAIQSLVAKLGLTSPDLTSLLRERFGVWSLHLLTKEQGEALHRALQDGLKEKQEGANKDSEKRDSEAAAPPAFAAPPVSSAAVPSAHNGRNASASGKAVRSH